MKLIVGLGNPGRIYVNSRHNVGFKCLDFLARRHGIRLSKRRAKSKIGTGEIAGLNVILAKPQTFMNLSGNAVQQLLHFYKIPLDQLLVIVDDLDLDTGKIRTRERGSDGGHRGLRSIAERLGTQDFKRIRIGVGRPKTGESVIKRVLGSSNDPKEEEQLQTAVKQATEISEAFIASGKFENWSSNLG